MNPSVRDALCVLAARLPTSETGILVGVFASARAGEWDVMDLRVQQVVPQALRGIVRSLIQVWRANEPDLPPAVVAGALEVASETIRVERQSHRTDLVWTGPESLVPLRSTEQVLRQVISAAKSQLLIVSYALYHVPEIGQLLSQATERKVHVACVLGSSRRRKEGGNQDNIAALGAAATRVALWHWCAAADRSGYSRGILHVKCIVADERILFLSSANLTRNALRDNMEMGILLEDERLSRLVVMHFTALMQAHVLVPLPVSTGAEEA